MSLPDKGTKHIPKPQAPIGSTKDGKLKVIDGRTGRESWRQGTKGFSKDFDGEPTAQTHNRAGLKKRPYHKPKMNVKHKSHRPRMGSRPQHQAGESSSDDE